MKIKITNARFEQALRCAKYKTPSKEWDKVSVIENAEEAIAEDPILYFDYMVWILFTTPEPMNEEEEDAKNTLDYLFQKYFSIEGDWEK